MKITAADRCNKVIKSIKKMGYGRTLTVGMYGTIKAYRCPKTRRRMYSLSNTRCVPAGGNLSAEVIRKDLMSVYGIFYGI